MLIYIYGKVVIDLLLCTVVSGITREGLYKALFDLVAGTGEIRHLIYEFLGKDHDTTGELAFLFYLY
jgi:hypothetical protein